MIYKIGLKHLSAFFLLFLIFSPSSPNAAETSYSIQTGTFYVLVQAKKQFNSLVPIADKEGLGFLRIEKVGKYYTVRLGRFKERSEAVQALKLVTPHLPGSIVLKVDYDDKRIVGFHSDETSALARVRELIEDKNYSDALALLLPFTADPMNHPESVSDYIVILVWVEQLDEAINMYEGLPSSFPRRSYLLRNVAKAYFDREEFLKSSSLYQAALDQIPSDIEAQKGLVLSLIRAGEYRKASDYLKGFLEKSPDSFQLTFLKAHLLFMEENYRELFMEENYRESIELYSRLAMREGIDSEFVYNMQDELITSLPDDAGQRLLTALRNDLQDRDGQAIQDYILTLILNREYSR
jgi:tetratricopeptide (TPR) repeat protein